MTDRAEALERNAARVASCEDTRGAHGDVDATIPSSLKRRILFVTTEMADYVKVGGLGEVSAALPRALAGDFDVRVLIPGYAQVLARHKNLTIVAELPAHAGLPACRLARARAADGLVVYILLSRELYDRDGTPYADRTGADWDDNHIRFGRLSSAAVQVALGRADASWSADLVHCNDWPCALTPAYMRWRGTHDSERADGAQSRVPGAFSARDDGRPWRARQRLPDRRGRVLRKALVHEGRPCVRRSHHDRERQLRARNHDGAAWLRPRGRAAPARRARTAHGHHQRDRPIVGCCDRSQPCRAIRDRRLVGQARQHEGRARGVRARRHERPSVCRRLAPRGAEGRRLRDRGGRRHRRARRTDRRHRFGRSHRSKKPCAPSSWSVRARWGCIWATRKASLGASTPAAISCSCLPASSPAASARCSRSAWEACPSSIARAASQTPCATASRAFSSARSRAMA